MVKFLVWENAVQWNDFCVVYMSYSIGAKLDENTT